MLYKEAVAIQIDLGRFSTAAKLQKEIGEIAESTSDLKMVSMVRNRPGTTRLRDCHWRPSFSA